MSFGDRDGSETRQVLGIQSVDLSNWTASGLTRWGTRVFVHLDISVGDVVSIPEPGEQWVVEKYMGVFVLVARVRYQDPRFLSELGVGDTSVGREGTLRLHGKRVELEAEEGLWLDGVPLGTAPVLQTNYAASPSSSYTKANFTLKSLDKTNFFSLSNGDVGVKKNGTFEVRTNSSLSLKVESGNTSYETSGYSSRFVQVEDKLSVSYKNSTTSSGDVLLEMRWISE